ncbi:hypothetical protein [Pontiella sulfatireligans]|uniref:NYN domain-containing protein n=1 Tax=Pontiella sulfatireligans TaxID=2750658 RepID=A0A6C2UHC9_9BACT|nr:hypothetical protein [Pontiella sulfatireligans]VGO19263.1 hypothetical protein SCARR_01320 [Pontiella sulfatireligans]
MGLFNLFKPAKTVLVVDCLSLNDSMGMKGKVPPRNQLQTLRRLTRFSQREKIEVVAVLCGAPLNKAPAGKKFEDITVLYSKSADVHAKFLAKTAASKGPGAILLSGNAAAEKLAGSSVKAMRVSTFRKAFDVGGDPEAPERGNKNGAPRSNRPPRRRPQKSGSGDNKPKERRPEKTANSEADAINELIDLVD